MTDMISDMKLLRFPLAIAVTGEKGHGKDTVAGIVLDILDGKIVRFADGLKEMLRAFYRTCGLDAEAIERKIEGDLKEQPCIHLDGKTPRYAMQTLGTEWRALIWSKLWVAQVTTRIRDSKAVTVTPDMRFLVEEQVFDELGGLKLRVVNPRVPRNESSTHSSETEMELIRVHATIVNDGSLEELRDKVVRVLFDLLSDHDAEVAKVLAPLREATKAEGVRSA